MGIAGEIGEHRPRSGKGRLGIHDPAFSSDRRKMTDESARLSELRQLAEKAEPPGTMEVEQPGEEQAPEQRPQDPHRQQEGRA